MQAAAANQAETTSRAGRSHSLGTVGQTAVEDMLCRVQQPKFKCLGPYLVRQLVAEFFD